MKLSKRRNDTSTLRKVYDDDCVMCYGIIGSVEDLMAHGLFESCDTNYSWAFISKDGKVVFADSKEEALEEIKED